MRNNFVEHIKIGANGTVTSQTRDADDLNKELIWRQFPPETTELMICAAYGDIFTARKIINNEVGRINSHGMTALMYACLNGRLELVKMLIDKEDIRLRNNEGLSGVDMAFYNRKFDCCLFLEDYCIKHGYNELKPKPRTNVAQQAAAMKNFKEMHEFDAEDMLEEIDGIKQRFREQQEVEETGKKAKPLAGPKTVVAKPPASTGNQQKQKFCTECGVKVIAGAKFCTECGHKLL